jgi:hypothetical protein
MRDEAGRCAAADLLHAACILEVVALEAALLVQICIPRARTSRETGVACDLDIAAAMAS